MEHNTAECAATQKGVADLCLHHLQCTCKCSYILVDLSLLCQHKLIMSITGHKSIEHNYNASIYNRHKSPTHTGNQQNLLLYKTHALHRIVRFQ